MAIDWSGAAPSWDRHRHTIEEMKAEVTELLLAAVRPLEGAQVLELGGGTGELAARLADEVGPTGQLTATDLAPGMVELLDKRLAAYPNVTVSRADAMDLDLPERSFDAVVFRMGLMMAPDPDRALAGIHRVLRPGGVFATTVWGTPQENPWMTAVGMAAAFSGLVAGGPPVAPGGPFSLGDPDDLARRVGAAGFSDVSVRRVPKTRHYRDAAQHVDEIGTLSPQLTAAFAAATPEQLAAVVEGVTALTAEYAAEGGGTDVPGTALLCVARRPG
ncbi:MAG TPA: class I SAM-dependent methyltransferase [Nocardioides sp.]|nr:class I SAM-dependent methyltransferase [Nocardioides sp.]